MDQRAGRTRLGCSKPGFPLAPLSIQDRFLIGYLKLSNMLVMSLLETIFSTTCRQSIADLKELKQLGSVSDTGSPSLIGKTSEPISVVKNPNKHMP